jgi:hypothetical protein
VIVQLRVVEGEGLEHHAGSRASRGLTVQVTDEAGKPVQNAAVSFRLPDSGPSGVFASGLRTEIVNSGPDGRASVYGIRWNNNAGPVEIRITAVKDQARAGIVSTQYLSEAASAAAAATVAPALSAAGGQGEFKASHKGRSKWLWLAAAAGGAAAAGMAFGHSRGASPAAASAPAGISIGSPSIIVGHP